jgi:hypothetical protein
VTNGIRGTAGNQQLRRADLPRHDDRASPRIIAAAQTPDRRKQDVPSVQTTTATTFLCLTAFRCHSRRSGWCTRRASWLGQPAQRAGLARVGGCITFALELTSAGSLRGGRREGVSEYRKVGLSAGLLVRPCEPIWRVPCPGSLPSRGVSECGGQLLRGRRATATSMIVVYESCTSYSHGWNHLNCHIGKRLRVSAG